MVRITDLKSKYIPYEYKNNLYYLRWGYEDVYEDIYEETGEVDEHGMPVRVPTGEKKETNLAVWTYEQFLQPVALEYIKNIILDWYNKEIDNKILSGFVWNEMPVWLSSENQFNYKAAYDLAVQTNGASLPVTFKLGESNGEPVYHTFTTMEEFTDFYMKTIAYINQCLNEGWQKKDAIDWTPYENALNPQSEVTEEPAEE